MNYRKSRKWMWILFFVGILIGISGAADGIVWVEMLATAVMLSGLLQAVVFYRCPHCGKSLLDVRGEIPKHCPNCGEELK